MEILSESVKKRKKGVPVRFVYEDAIPEKLLKKLTKRLNIIESDNLRSGGRYHNFKDFMSFPKVGKKHLHYPAMPPLAHKDIPINISILELIRKKDIMLHYPYQSFQYIVDLLREASIDPQVTAIKMTFYRAARDSSVMNALINAARNRKEVSVFMELQARFDEEANIFWTNKLVEDGVRIIPTIPGFKVHSKLILIKRNENGQEVGYANVSTGNFNESTAKVYADDSLLTSNQAITSDVDKVFKLMEMRFKPPIFESLIVSPFANRAYFTGMLENEIKNKQEGKDAWAIIKLNSLVDKKIIRKIYEANQAGVKLQIIVRGICVLVPGVPGLSDNIEVFSIVDKYLEHTRVYVFCNNNDNKYFISSISLHSFLSTLFSSSRMVPILNDLMASNSLSETIEISVLPPPTSINIQRSFPTISSERLIDLIILASSIPSMVLTFNPIFSSILLMICTPFFASLMAAVAQAATPAGLYTSIKSLKAFNVLIRAFDLFLDILFFLNTSIPNLTGILTSVAFSTYMIPSR